MNNRGVIMNTYCGAECEQCNNKEKCKGCVNTCGSPFGGRCIAAEYIKTGGMSAYEKFKEQLKCEINTLLKAESLPTEDKLFELVGEYVNFEYTLPGGKKVKFLNDKNIYLGTQIEIPDISLCYGVVADTTFIMICSYGANGSNPEILMFKRR